MAQAAVARLLVFQLLIVWVVLAPPAKATKVVMLLDLPRIVGQAAVVVQVLQAWMQPQETTTAQMAVQEPAHQ